MSKPNDFDELPEEEEIELVSKSEIKREMLALQALGERLVKLNPRMWAQFNFSQAMRDALDESLRIKSQNAMRRHIRRLGKLLRDEDAEQVKKLFERMDNEHLQDTQYFHRLERWRDRLLAEGDSALQELLDICPNIDRQHLRQLIRVGKKEQEQGKSPAASRKIFKYLRQLEI